MKVRDLIAVLQKIDQDYEIAMLTANAFARPPTVERAQRYAWSNNSGGIVPAFGLNDATRSYLLRPKQDVI